jgi:hypothetical protein
MPLSDSEIKAHIKRVQKNIRLNAEKYGDEHRAWSFELDIFIEGILFRNPSCQKTLGLMDESAPDWRLHAASEFAKQMSKSRHS